MRKLLNRKNLRYMTTPDGEEGGAGPVFTDPRHDSFKDTTFTQEQVTAFMTREKDQGRRAGVREWAEKLSGQLKAAGFPEDANLDELLALARSKQKSDEALKSEAEKTAEAAVAAKTEAERVLAEAKKELFEAKLERHLAGASNAVVARASLTAYTVNVDSSEDDIKAAVDQLKADAPGLFTPATPIPPHTDPGNSGRKQSTQTSPRDRARAMAEERGWRKAS